MLSTTYVCLVCWRQNRKCNVRSGGLCDGSNGTRGWGLRGCGALRARRWLEADARRGARLGGEVWGRVVQRGARWWTPAFGSGRRPNAHQRRHEARTVLADARVHLAASGARRVDRQQKRLPERARLVVLNRQHIEVVADLRRRELTIVVSCTNKQIE